MIRAPDGATGFPSTAGAVAHVLVDGPLADDVTIAGDEGHHLQRVRRLRAGEAVTAGDGDGRWRPYEVAAAKDGCLDLVATGGTVVEPRLEPALTVAFAVVKGDRPELVVAALTELGVDAIVPVLTRRSVVDWRGERADAARDRLARVAAAAAAQSRRSRLPVVERPCTIADLAGRPDVVVADAAGSPAADLAEPGPAGWLLVVGPEGGLEDAEVEGLAPAARLGLGPHVLRSVTAVIAGAAALSGRRTPSDCHGA